LDKKDAEILEQILKIHTEVDDSIGAKKIGPLLGIGKNRCQRIMTKYGVRARKKRDGYTYGGKSDEVFANLLLADDLKAADIYYSDLFEFKLIDGTEVHGCFVLRHSTRQVVGILFDYFEDAGLVEGALESARDHIVDGSIFHVDQGGQNGSAVVVQKTKDLKMSISMSRAGTPTDNPFAERFVRTFKLAVVYKQQYFTLSQFLCEAVKWLSFYNDLRPHEALGNKSPNLYAKENGIQAVSLDRIFRV
jgi:putative transposase